MKPRLDSLKDLFHCDARPPAFVVVQNGQADGAGRVDVRVEKRRGELEERVVVRILSSGRSIRGRLASPEGTEQSTGCAD